MAEVLPTGDDPIQSLKALFQTKELQKEGEKLSFGICCGKLGHPKCQIMSLSPSFSVQVCEP